MKRDKSIGGAPARTRQIIRYAASAFVVSTISLLAATQAASPANPIPDVAAWGANIAQVDPAGEGCFTAAYPSMQWIRIACGPTPKRLLPARGLPPATVGSGNDYAAAVPGLIRSTTGTFPVTKRLRSEHDDGTGTDDTYSFQLNSNYFAGSPACAGAAVPADCKAWQQFVFTSKANGSPTYGNVTMQYWLLRYAPAPCPKGWNSFYPHCVTNSKTVYLGFPQLTIPFQYISDLTFTGTANAGGRDRAVLVTKAQAYAVSASDNVIHLAQFWNQSEFNVFGINDGSNAIFNKGASIKVRLDVKDGAGDAPSCVGNAGTTAEGNNLTLGACYTARRTIQFRETN